MTTHPLLGCLSFTPFLTSLSHIHTGLWPTWQVVRDIVVPATVDTRCRYSDLPSMTKFVGAPTIFVSHCWAAMWGDLVGAVCQGADPERTVWVDIFGKLRPNST